MPSGNDQQSRSRSSAPPAGTRTIPPILLSIAFLLLPSFGGVPPAARTSQTGSLDRCYRIELGRIEETYRILDALAMSIWPGWNGYSDISFQVQFPNRTLLLLNPGVISAKGFDPLPGQAVRGKPVFLNRSEEVPFELKPPLTGGGGGSRGVRIRLRSRTVEPGREKTFSSDEQILLYVHELFHGFQGTAWKWDREALRGADEDTPADAGRAAWYQISCRALLRAFQEQSRERALEFLRSALAASAMETRGLTPPTIRYRRHMTTAEGTAVYAAIRAASQMSERRYQPSLSRELDPFFFGFEDAAAYVRKTSAGDLAALPDHPFETLGFQYAGGAVMALLLDRLKPDWKSGFFQRGLDLEDLLEAASRFSGADAAGLAASAAREFGYDGLRAENERVLRARDEAVRLVTGRKGKRFILDGSLTKEFFQIRPRGEEIRIGSALYFPRGIELLTLGDVELKGVDSPMSRPGLYLVEWVDTEPPRSGPGYELAFRKREGSTYFDAVLTTKGFTLRAPEIRLIEEDGAVRVVILSKTGRTTSGRTVSKLREAEFRGFAAANISPLIAGYMTRNEVPGLQVALVDRSGVFWEASLGTRTRGVAAPVDSETSFLIASVTKPLTATIVLRAVELGLVELDRPIADYLPDIRFRSRYEQTPERKMTLRLLLSHRSGLAHEAPLGNNWDGIGSTLEEHARSLDGNWLKWPVGERSDYSGAGFDLAAYVLQRVMKKEYRQCARELLFDPLGMSRSTLDAGRIVGDRNRASGHTKRFGNPPPLIVPDEGGGGVFSTAGDLAAFIRFHLNGGTLGGRRFIAGDLLEQMYRVPGSLPGQLNGTALGLNRWYDFGGKWLKSPRWLHTGGGRGFGSVIQWFPEAGLGIAILTNSWDSDPLDLSDSIMAKLFDHIGQRPTEEDGLERHVRGSRPVSPNPEVEGDYLSFKVTVSGRTPRIRFGDEPELRLVFTSGEEAYCRNASGALTVLRFFKRRSKDQGRYAVSLRRGLYYSRAEPLPLPGPEKDTWSRYCGRYLRNRWGEETAPIDVSLRDGWLWGAGTPLLEVQEGVFYQVNGNWENAEIFDFRSSPPTYRNLKLYGKGPAQTGDGRPDSREDCPPCIDSHCPAS